VDGDRRISGRARIRLAVRRRPDRDTTHAPRGGRDRSGQPGAASQRLPDPRSVRSGRSRARVQCGPRRADRARRGARAGAAETRELDRRAAVHEHQRRPGQRVLLRRDLRGDPQHARRLPGPERDRPDVVVRVQGQRVPDPADLGIARRPLRAAGERAQARQPAAHRGAAAGRERRPGLGEDVRPRASRRVRDPVGGRECRRDDRRGAARTGGVQVPRAWPGRLRGFPARAGAAAPARCDRCHRGTRTRGRTRPAVRRSLGRTRDRPHDWQPGNAWPGSGARVRRSGARPRAAPVAGAGGARAMVPAADSCGSGGRRDLAERGPAPGPEHERRAAVAQQCARDAGAPGRRIRDARACGAHRSAAPVDHGEPGGELPGSRPGRAGPTPAAEGARRTEAFLPCARERA
jgi:hypothetical protein